MQAIKVENLSKRYFLGTGKKNNTLRDLIVNWFQNPLASRKKQELWALRDVNFELQDGETLGIIGQNGAGKSTLLKVLSRITKPTTGKVRIRGRVGSLLEVGTGFHQELSGRENIYLSGAIMGMRRREIERKFDEIVAFAETERFLDTPVKHYSSGMFMRLAFSVAAHLEPEILIVDEVLAVGDIKFQKKSLNKMRDVSQSGHTVLFVSHDMSAITRLCDRAIWLNGGELVSSGKAESIVAEYLQEQSRLGSIRTWDDPERMPGNEITRLRQVRVRDEDGKTVSSVDIRRPVSVEMTYDVLQSGKVLAPNIHFYNDRGICLFISVDVDPEWRQKPRPAGTYVSRVWIPGNFLAEGTVFVTIAATTFQPMEVHFNERDAIIFNVSDSTEGNSARGDYGGSLPGVIRPLLDWETEFDPK